MFKRSKRSLPHPQKLQTFPRQESRTAAADLLPRGLQLGTLLQRAGSMSTCQRELHAAHARAVSLEEELESERQRHAATSACLQQEQEMLAILGARLAAVETVAGTSTTDVIQLQQHLQEEQQLHDVALRSLVQLRKANQELQQQLASLAHSTSMNSTGNSSSLRIVLRAVSLATGLAAAAVLQATTVPPAVVALAWPAVTAAVTAKAAAALLGGLAWACRQVFHVTETRHEGLQDGIYHPEVSTAAAFPASYNCWHYQHMYSYTDDSSNSSATSSSSCYADYISSNAYETSSSGSEHEEQQLGCAWDSEGVGCALKPCSSTDSSTASESCSVQPYTDSSDCPACVSCVPVLNCDLCQPCSPMCAEPAPSKQEPERSPGRALTCMLTEQQCDGADSSCMQVQTSALEQGCLTYARGWVLETVHEDMP